MPTASCPHLNYKRNFRKELGSAKLILQCFDTFLVWEYFSRLFCLSVSIVQNCISPMRFPVYFILTDKPKQLQNVDNCSLLRDLDKRYFI